MFEKFSDALADDRPHVVLHCPGDSGNVGTIIRTALGFGVEDLAMIRPCVDLFDPKTVAKNVSRLEIRRRVVLFQMFCRHHSHSPPNA